MSTPVRAQYLRLKQPFPDALLLFRLGDFYELYGRDATIAARELELPLTAREFGGSECIPMCPLPYHAVETPIKRLVARGYKVAITEQIGDPRTAHGLVEREVVRVVTPGLAIEDLPHSPLHRDSVGTVEAPRDDHDPSAPAYVGRPATINPMPASPHGGAATRATPPTDDGRAIQLTLFPHG